MISNRSKGFIYEEKAISFLEKEGLHILCKNYMGSYGELDIICKKDKTLVFVEVKYRKNSDYGYGQEAIDTKKQRRLYYTAMEYIRKNRYYNWSIRFDAVIFLDEKIHWIKNILWGDEIGF